MNNEITFKKGDRLRIGSHHMNNGLNYEAFIGTALEDGRSGGWDVYDIKGQWMELISVYGFSIIEKLD